MIDRSRYHGVLSPHLTDVIRRHNAGEPHHSIGWRYDVNGAAVTHALKRIGVLPDAFFVKPPGPRRQRLIDEKDELIAVPSLRGTGKGRPLDMGGPRDVWIED